MSSPSNDIHSDLRELLGTDILTPDMERVVGVMRAYRPRVDIDASYRNKLKQSLLTPSAKKTPHTRPSWFAWMGWIGTSCAALIVTLGVVRILYPEKPQYREHTPATVESPTLEVATIMDTPTTDTMIADIKTESTIAKIQGEQSNTPMVRMTEPTPETSSTDIIPTISDAPAPMLADASVGGGYMMMAIPEGDTLAKTSTAMPPPAMMTTSPVDTPHEPTISEVDTEIQDMIWEINTIINEAGSRDQLTVPDYPTAMPIYIKESVYTPDEITLLAGTGITSAVLETYAPDILQSHIIEQRDTMVLTGTPTVRYIVRQKGNQSILLPAVVYTTNIGTHIEVPLIPGY